MGYDIYRVGEDPENGPDYHRRNIWGMSPVRDACFALGMAQWGEGPGLDLGCFCSNDGMNPGADACRYAAERWSKVAPDLPESVWDGETLRLPTEGKKGLAATEDFFAKMFDIAFKAKLQDEADQDPGIIEVPYWNEWVEFLESCGRAEGMEVC